MKIIVTTFPPDFLINSINKSRKKAIARIIAKPIIITINPFKWTYSCSVFVVYVGIFARAGTLSLFEHNEGVGRVKTRRHIVNGDESVRV